MVKFLTQLGLFLVVLIAELLALILITMVNSTNEDVETSGAFVYVFMHTLLISLLIGKLIL